MKSYIARMVFKVDWEPAAKGVVFEEQLRIFIAEDKLAAFTQANIIGHTEEGNFPFYSGGSVTWTFLGMTALDEIGQIHSGLLLDSSQRPDTSDDQEAFLRTQVRRFNGQIEVETMSDHSFIQG